MCRGGGGRFGGGEIGRRGRRAPRRGGVEESGRQPASASLKVRQTLLSVETQRWRSAPDRQTGVSIVLPAVCRAIRLEDSRPAVAGRWASKPFRFQRVATMQTSRTGCQRFSGSTTDWLLLSRKASALLSVETQRWRSAPDRQTGVSIVLAAVWQDAQHPVHNLMSFVILPSSF
jgi:hypothetical protein